MLLNYGSMITQQQYESVVERAAEMLKQAGIVLTAEERARFEVADFGLGELEKTGLEIITYINTERVCAKELVLLPHQTCPEHWHPTAGNRLGKEETFRCRWGTVYLYVPGPPAAQPACRPPEGSEAYYTVGHEICLRPGEQYTLYPDTRHWFQAGPEGAIVSEFSTRSTDDQDLFADPRIKRLPEIAQEVINL
jgi:D-lyxose ketol-isomerase